MGEGFDSFAKKLDVAIPPKEAPPPISDSIEQLEIAAGVAGSVVKGMDIISRLLHGNEGLKRGIEWSAKSIRLASVVIAQLAVNPAMDVEASLRTLNSVAGQARAERIEDQRRALVSEHGPNEMQFEHFLDALKIPLEQVHAKFNYASLPLHDPRRLALTVAFANVFWDDSQNEISRLNIASNPEYRERLADVVGINFWLDEVAKEFGVEQEDSYGKQTPLDDIDEEGIPIPMKIREEQREFTRSERGWAFAKQLLEIRKSPEYHALRKVVRDSGEFDRFEVLLNPEGHTKEEVAEARQNINISAIFGDSTTAFDAVIRNEAA